MAKLDIVSLADYINRKYSSFAEHPIAFGCANIRTFMELVKMDSFFQRTPSAVSCDFDAVTKGGRPIAVRITRENGGSQEAGLRYSISEV